jgi:hypothetical protein
MELNKYVKIFLFVLLFSIMIFAGVMDAKDYDFYTSIHYAIYGV